VTSEMDKYLSHAILLYTNWDGSSFPRNDADAVIQEYGEILGEELLTDLHKGVLKELHEMPPDWDVETMEEASDRVRAVIVRDHPGLEPLAVDALMWRYDFGWK
jgi:hypothetical protein